MSFLFNRIFYLFCLLAISSSVVAAELKTFIIETEEGVITVTQDIPSVFFGDYAPLKNSPTPGGLTLTKGRNFVSQYWSVRQDLKKRFTWGVVVKDGKIESEQVTPANEAYKPYEKMRLILQHEDGVLEAMRMYRTKSEEFGTRVVYTLHLPV